MNRGFARAIACVLLAASLFLAVPEVMAVSSVKVTKESKLYSSAKSSSAALVTIKKGEYVTFIELVNESFARVIAKNREGFMLISCLNINIKAPSSSLSSATAVYTIEPGVATASTKLRTQADSTAPAITTIPQGAELSVLSSSDTWWKVVYNGREGYALGTDLRLGTKEDASSSTAIPADDVNAKKIAKAQKKNSDVIGWVNVPNTNVDEPVLYGANFYYADHDINKKKAYTSTYSYSASLTKNVVIFGHNIRKSASVFHGLLHLKEAALGKKRCPNSLCRRSIKSSLQSWYKTKAGRTWNVSIFGKQKWEVFAMYEVPEDEPMSTLRYNWTLSPPDMEKWLSYQLARSQIDFGVKVSAQDQILTLITCGTDYDFAEANSRLFVFLKNVD